MRATILPPPPPADFSGRSAYHAISGTWWAGDETWTEEEVWSAVWTLDDQDPAPRFHASTDAPESSDVEGLPVLETILAPAG
jgi:hypothetical protein